MKYDNLANFFRKNKGKIIVPDRHKCYNTKGLRKSKAVKSAILQDGWLKTKSGGLT